MHLTEEPIFAVNLVDRKYNFRITIVIIVVSVLQ